MSSERQFEKTFSRRKKAKSTDIELTDTDEKEEGLQENGEDKATASVASTSTAFEVTNVPSSSADSSRGDSNDDETREPAAENGGSNSGANKLRDKLGMKSGGDAEKKQQQKKQSQPRNQKKPVKPKEVKKDRGQKRENGDVDRGTKKKKVEGKEVEIGTEQVEGSTESKFPMYRVDKIIRSEGSDLRITNEAVFLINKSAEKFLEVFCKDSYSCAAQIQKNYVSYKNLATVVSEDKRLDFLADFVPEKVTAEKALAERKPVEKATD